MNLEQFANVAEIVGMIMVIVSLIYLNIQVRQNTTMLRSTATQGATDNLVEMYDSLISDESMTDIFMRGLTDPDSLSPIETGRFFAWWMRAMFITQNWYFQTREQLLDRSTLDSLGKLMSDMGQSPGLQSFWKARKFAFDPDFVRFMDEELLARDGSSEYRPLSTSPS